MTYRDDREALRARADEAERQRDEAQREVERLRRERSERMRAEVPFRTDELFAMAKGLFERIRTRWQGEPGALKLAIVVGIVGALVGFLVPLISMTKPGETPKPGETAKPPPSLPIAAGAEPPERFTTEVERAGRATEVTGNTPVVVDTTCELRVLPVRDDRFNCRVFVECAGKTIYGGGTAGYTTCTVENDAPARATDPRGSRQDNDPMLTLDLPRNRVVVRDDPVSGPWSVELTLADPADPADPAAPAAPPDAPDPPDSPDTADTADPS